MAGGEKKLEGQEKSLWKNEESAKGGRNPENGFWLWYQYINLMQIKVAWDLFKNLSAYSIIITILF